MAALRVSRSGKTRRKMHINLERRVFADWFADLRTAAAPLVDELTAKLYSARLIERETRDNDIGTPTQKAERVLRCVENSIDRKPNTFHDFVDILNHFPSLNDIVCCLRESTVVAPQRVEDTSDGRSRLCLGADVDTASASHDRAPPPGQLDHKLSELQITSSHSRQDSDVFKADRTMASEMLPGIHYVGGYRQGTYLSEAAACRHAQVVPSPSLAVTDEHGAVRPFYNNITSDGDWPSEKKRTVSFEQRLSSTFEERSPAKNHSPYLAMNFDVSQSRLLVERSSSCSSSGSLSSLDCGEFEDSEQSIVLVQYKKSLESHQQITEQNKVMTDLYHRAKRENVDLKKKLKKMEKHKEKENLQLNKELKLTREEANEESHRCSKLRESNSLQEITTQSLQQQNMATQKECQRLNDLREQMTRKVLNYQILLRNHEQLLAEKDDGYRAKYCESQKENTQLRHRLTEYEQKIELLEGQIDCLLELKKNPPAHHEDTSQEDQDSVQTTDSTDKLS